MGQESFQQEIGRGHVGIHKHSDSSPGSQAWPTTRASSTPSLPPRSPPAERMALGRMSHICATQNSLQSAAHYTEGFTATVTFNGGGGGGILCPLPPPSTVLGLGRSDASSFSSQPPKKGEGGGQAICRPQRAAEPGSHQGQSYSGWTWPGVSSEQGAQAEGYVAKS